MTKQRKMLLGVLVLGVGGLAVDRFVIGMPEDASASDEVVAVVEEAPPAIQPRVTEQAQSQPQANDSTLQSLPSYAGLTERLIQAQQQQPAGASGQREDPFALPDQWQASRPITPGQPEPDVADKHYDRMNELFRLDGTVRSDINGKEELLALVSGAGLDSRAIRVGQQLTIPYEDGSKDSYKLVKVGPRFAIWQVVGTQETVVMRVEEDL